MLAIERRREILAKLMSEGKVLVSELSRDFGVTEETIRRDLERLDKEGLVSKTYGGAVSKQNAAMDLPYNVREGVNVEKKQAISDQISNLIEDGERIMLDSSSTALYVLKKLKNKKNLTIITNSVKILIELADKQDWTVLSTGGLLKKGALSLTGSSAEKMIHSYYVDTAVCSCKGLDMDKGITDTREPFANLKQVFLKSAKQVILAVDHTKFDQISFVRLGELDDIDIVVTDVEPSDKWKNFFAEKQIKLLY